MNRLREVRFFKKVTQWDLALLTHVQQCRISLIENGYVKPRSDEKERLAKALGVQVDHLWNENGDQLTRLRQRKPCQKPAGRDD